MQFLFVCLSVCLFDHSSGTPGPSSCKVCCKYSIPLKYFLQNLNIFFLLFKLKMTRHL